jgi:hypothetical protein
METKLNAGGYKYNATNYTKEFQRVLCGVFTCYTIMLSDNVELPNDEEEIRNKLLFDYLSNDNIAQKNELFDYAFNAEVLEPTGGKVDLKVQRKNRFTKSEAYYIIECKRLNNKSSLNQDYINKGIYRFVSKHYSTNCRVNAMIGFVVKKIKISTVIQNINSLLDNPKIKNCNTTQKIQQETFIPNFEFHYSSAHNDIDNKSFTLYHLMLDFSGNIKILPS